MGLPDKLRGGNRTNRGGNRTQLCPTNQNTNHTNHTKEPEEESSSAVSFGKRDRHDSSAKKDSQAASSDKQGKDSQAGTNAKADRPKTAPASNSTEANATKPELPKWLPKYLKLSPEEADKFVEEQAREFGWPIIQKLVELDDYGRPRFCRFGSSSDVDEFRNWCESEARNDAARIERAREVERVTRANLRTLLRLPDAEADRFIEEMSSQHGWPRLGNATGRLVERINRGERIK